MNRKKLAAALMAFDESLDGSDEQFKSLYSEFYVNLGQWENAEHMGDCTKFPATCVRCLHDDYMDHARKFEMVLD